MNMRACHGCGDGATATGLSAQNKAGARAGGRTCLCDLRERHHFHRHKAENVGVEADVSAAQIVMAHIVITVQIVVASIVMAQMLEWKQMYLWPT